MKADRQRCEMWGWEAPAAIMGLRGHAAQSSEGHLPQTLHVRPQRTVTTTRGSADQTKHWNTHRDKTNKKETHSRDKKSCRQNLHELHYSGCDCKSWIQTREEVLSLDEIILAADLIGHFFSFFQYCASKLY